MPGSNGHSLVEMGLTEKDLGIRTQSAPDASAKKTGEIVNSAEKRSLPEGGDLECKREIQEEIVRQGGKIPFSKFMEISLHGKSGYYSTGRVKIGPETEADFNTYSGKSRFFSTAVGESVLKVWEAMDKPAKFDLIEMGAGYGQLARSLLEWAQIAHPDFYQVLHYHILEYGGGLIPKQKAQVASLEGIEPGKIDWVQGSAYQLPFAGVNGVFISNELPDAFPVDIVRNIDGEIKQKYVFGTITRNEKGQEDYVFRETWDKPSPEISNYIRTNKYQISEAEDDLEFETPININALKFQKELNRALERGAILTIDYGYNYQQQYSQELGAVRVIGRDKGFKSGRDEYLYPGMLDITSDINFQALEQQAKKDGLNVAFTIPQAELIDSVAPESLDAFSKILATKPSEEEKVREFDNYAGYLQNANLRKEVLLAQLIVKGIDPSSLTFRIGTPITEADLIKTVAQMGEPGQNLQKILEARKSVTS